MVKLLTSEEETAVSVIPVRKAQVEQLQRHVGYFLELSRNASDEQIAHLKEAMRQNVELLLRTVGRDDIWEGLDAMYQAIRNAAERALRIIDEWPAPPIDLFQEKDEEQAA